MGRTSVTMNEPVTHNIAMAANPALAFPQGQGTVTVWAPGGIARGQAGREPTHGPHPTLPHHKPVPLQFSVQRPFLPPSPAPSFPFAQGHCPETCYALGPSLL